MIFSVLPFALSLATVPAVHSSTIAKEIFDPQPDTAGDLIWDLFLLPETVTRLAFTPLHPILSVTEEFRLDRRVYDLLTNDEETALLIPIVEFVASTGVGGGFIFTHSNLFGNSEDLAVSVIVQGDLGRSASLSYGEDIAWLDGREISLDFEYQRDKDERYFGIGGDTPLEDERALGEEIFDAEFGLGLLGPVWTQFDLDTRIGFRHEQLSEGQHTRLASVSFADTVVAPPGFGLGVDYPKLGISAVLDSRDTKGRTNEGFKIDVDLETAVALGSERFSMVRGTVEVGLFVPVLIHSRVLALYAGFGGVRPYSDEHEVPLFGLVELGGSRILRGYRSGRFRDRTGWWASAEYRYPIFDYGETGIGLSSTLFVDAGRVGSTPAELFRESLLFTGGFGVRAETSTALAFRLQVGISSEGPEFIFSVNDLL